MVRNIYQLAICNCPSFTHIKVSVCGCTGNIYTGLVDGRIIKISKDLKTYSTVLRTGIDSEDCGKGTIENSSIIVGSLNELTIYANIFN